MVQNSSRSVYGRIIEVLPKFLQHTDWFVDRTPGLYESAVEIRVQDCDSDDETEGKQYYNTTKNLICKDIVFTDFSGGYNVSIADAEFNVLHTCVVMDCLGHCAIYLGERFDNYVFQALHKILLKLGKFEVQGI